MPTRRPIARRTRKGGASFSKSRPSREVLRALLSSLADQLLDDGVTPQQISDLAKEALISSAATDARMATGRINHSKVAAATGLSRSEVRRRLAEVAGNTPIPLRALDRTSRVIAGWLRDPIFLGRDGKPKELPLNGPGVSFASLVRLHSGDIPPRVVLEAMKKKGFAKLVKDKVALVPRIGDTPSRGSGALAEATPYVAQLLATASLPKAQLGFAHQVQLTAEDTSHEILLTEHVVRILSAAIGAIEARKDSKGEATDTSRTLRITLTMLSAPKTPQE